MYFVESNGAGLRCHLGKDEVNIYGGEGLIQKAGVLAELGELGAVHVVHRRTTAEGGKVHKEPLQVLCNTDTQISGYRAEPSTSYWRNGLGQQEESVLTSVFSRGPLLVLGH